MFQCLREWRNHLLNFDRLLQEAFKLAIKTSLSIMYEALRGDGTTAPTPFLRLEVDLFDNKVRIITPLRIKATKVVKILLAFKININEAISNFETNVVHNNNFSFLLKLINQHKTYT